VFLVQAASEIDEIADEDAKKLVNAVLRQMRPILRRILRNELKYGANEAIPVAATRVRVKRGTYAVQKCRAFKRFSQLAVPTANRLGIRWRVVTEEAPRFEIFESDDEDEIGEGAE
jgi:hypothetical protein